METSKDQMQKLKLAVLVSGSGTNLQSLIDAQKEGYFNSEIALVVSNKASAYGLKRAENAGIKAIVIKSDKELLDTLLENEIDLIVLAGYLKVISPELINAYENKIINIHPSLLPEYGGHGMYGLYVHENVFADKKDQTGATVHYVTAEVDEGPIIIQKKLIVDYDTIKSPEELQRAVLIIEHEILKEAIKIIEN